MDMYYLEYLIMRKRAVGQLTGITFFESDAIPSTAEELIGYLSQFELNSGLREIAKASASLSAQGLQAREVDIGNPKPVYYGQGILSYCAICLIEHTRPTNIKLFTRNELVIATRMYHGLPEPHFTGRKGLDTILRQHNAQFTYQHPLGYLLARTLTLFNTLWNLHPNAAELDLSRALNEITGGLTLEEILILGKSFQVGFRNANGILPVHLLQAVSKYKRRNGTVIEASKVQKFIDWLLTTTIVSSSESYSVSPDFDRFRFNPLRAKPIILGSGGKIQPLSYICPIPDLILYRITLGLYYDLLQYYKAKGNTFYGAFGNIFGDVFESYIQLLFDRSGFLGTIEGERIYGSPERKNPDALIIEGDTFVSIQAKVSALYANAKTSGSPDYSVQDLQRTMARAVEQLWEFERDVDSGAFAQLEDLRPIQSRQRLVVLYDEVTFGNSFLRDLTFEAIAKNDQKRIQKGIPALSIPNDFHFHVMTIAEVESLLTEKDQSLYGFLKEKGSPEASDLGMGNYIKGLYDDRRNKFLDGVQSDFEAPFL